MGKTKNIRLNLSKRRVEALQPLREARRQILDTQINGLGVMVQPSGHKSFYWYRKIDGRPTWKTIGEFPEMSVEQARERASELNAQLSTWKQHGFDGTDPFVRRRRVTLGEVLDDYVNRHLGAHAKNPARAKKDTLWQFEFYIGTWRPRSLGSIQAEHVVALHQTVKEKHGQYSANRLLQLVRRLFNWAVEAKLWQGANPASRIKLFREERRTRFLLPAEAKQFFKALMAEKNMDLRDFVVLALLTGARRSNVLALRWEQLDLNRGLWTIPDPKNRVPYTVPLVGKAVELLRARRNRVKGEWVFPSESKSGHVTDVKKAWARLLKRAAITGLRVHDLRRTLGSWQAGAGVSLPIIGKSLGHLSSAATEVYAQLDVDPVREAVNTATNALLTAGKASRWKLLEAPRG